MKKPRCGETWRLSCGCFADVEVLVCERKSGHSGPHRESFDARGLVTPLPSYKFEWKEED